MTDEWRSPSQQNEYNRCPYSYYLARRLKVWKRPAAWLAHGTAVHSALEAWERSNRVMTLEDVQAVFCDEYTTMINEELQNTPNPKSWFSSGPYGGLADIPRRFEVGQEHVAKVLAYYDKHPDEWPDTLNGELAVELHMDTYFGDVRVVGYIDWVRDGKPYDYKTGTLPGGDEQLATYAGYLKQSLDIPFSEGFFFMARNGKPTRPYDLTGWSIERLADVYGELDENIKAERFDPKPDADVCYRCPVASSCEFKYSD